MGIEISGQLVSASQYFLNSLSPNWLCFKCRYFDLLSMCIFCSKIFYPFYINTKKSVQITLDAFSFNL